MPFDPSQPRDPQGRWTSNGSNAVAMGVAVTLVASALAGGGVGGAGIPRASRSQSQARTSITDITSDTVRATIRLQRMGRYHGTVDLSDDDSACDAHSYGDIHQFFTAHRCRSLTRGLVEIRDKNYVVLIAIATVDMPDYATAMELHTLLFDDGNGGITQLSRERGRYRRVAFTHAARWWRRERDHPDHRPGSTGWSHTRSCRHRSSHHLLPGQPELVGTPARVGPLPGYEGA
jgi:hypothetical protein